MRIKHLETVSAHNHPSPTVAAGKKLLILSVATTLLQSSITRKKAMVAEPQLSSLEKEKLVKELESIGELLQAIKCGEGEACGNWDFELTWIVARKAMIIDEKEAWMSRKYPV